MGGTVVRMQGRHLYALGEFDEGTPSFYDVDCVASNRDGKVCLRWKAGGEIYHMLFLPTQELRLATEGDQ